MSAQAISRLAYIGDQLEISSDHRRYRSPKSREKDWFQSTCKLDFPDPTSVAIEKFSSVNGGSVSGFGRNPSSLIRELL
jgi:hypothetical protein